MTKGVNDDIGNDVQARQKTLDHPQDAQDRLNTIDQWPINQTHSIPLALAKIAELRQMKLDIRSAWCRHSEVTSGSMRLIKADHSMPNTSLQQGQQLL